jgi:hypothetical protein
MLLSMVQGLAPSPDILPAIDRFVGLIGGIAMVAAAQGLIAPFVYQAVGALLGVESSSAAA